MVGKIVPGALGYNLPMLSAHYGDAGRLRLSLSPRGRRFDLNAVLVGPVTSSPARPPSCSNNQSATHICTTYFVKRDIEQ